MVISRVSEEEKSHKFMEMSRERSKPLHNFSMPDLKWGNQRFLRCMKVDSNGEIVSSVDRRSSSLDSEFEDLMIRRKDNESEKRRFSNGLENFTKSQSPLIRVSGRKSEIQRDRDDGIEEIREKLMFHLRTAADKMKLALPKEGEEEESSPAATMRLWNLRTRRAACKAPNESGGGSIIEERKQKFSPLRTENPTTKSLRLRGLAATEVVEKKKRAKFSVRLSRQEIEQDFLTITGMRPPRKPKKRAKIIQKQLNVNFPGLWLSEIATDRYKISDLETGTR